MIKKINNFLFALSTCAVVCSVPGGALSDEGPYTRCLTLLTNDIADTIIEKVDLDKDAVILSSDMLVEFFAKHIEDCRDYLLSRESPEKDILIEDPDLWVDIKWDYLVDEVTAALTTTANYRQLFVCENNRGWQAGIDGALWAGTAVASIYSFGSAGVAATGARTAVTQGAKNLVKVGVKSGGKTTAKEAAISATAQKLGMKLAEKEAAAAAAKAAEKAGVKAATVAARDKAVLDAKLASAAVAKNATITNARATLLKGSGKKRISDTVVRKDLQKQLAAAKSATKKKELGDAIKLLDDKADKYAAKRLAQNAYRAEENALKTAAADAAAALTAEHAAAQTALNNALKTFAISTPLAALGGAASVYSFLQSDLNTQVMNCKKTHANSGCYLSCNKDILSAPTDDLNTKVFKPILGKTLCIDEETNFVLREINPGLPTPGDVFITTNEKWERVKQKIVQDVANNGNCDWKVNDIDMYVASPLYDSSTLEPAGDGATGLLIDAVRIDD